MEKYARSATVQVYGTCSESACRKWSDFCDNWDDMVDECYRKCMQKCTYGNLCETPVDDGYLVNGCGVEPSVVRSSNAFLSAISSASGSCPGSKAWIHAKCQLDATQLAVARMTP